MKTTTAAAVAALVALARPAVAQTPGPAPGSVAAEAARAAGEARALVATMQTEARVAWRALERARERRKPSEVRCSDEALSRADAALRTARDEVARMTAAYQSNDVRSGRASLVRVRWRAIDAREAAAAAGACSTTDAISADGRTTVTVYAPRLPAAG